ncbi:hypothetical protein JGF48_24145 [Salmonella enterica subsp. enterica serovar Corvallis]|nr:hypothetical protein [Salmonella enterica subsp. enterica serovar Corvallis]
MAGVQISITDSDGTTAQCVISIHAEGSCLWQGSLPVHLIASFLDCARSQIYRFA